MRGAVPSGLALLYSTTSDNLYLIRGRVQMGDPVKGIFLYPVTDNLKSGLIVRNM